eukprot:2033829-Rhodomonas_salina.1
MAHHAFGAWNGDRRLSNQYGQVSQRGLARVLGKEMVDGRGARLEEEGREEEREEREEEDRVEAGRCGDVD